MNVRQTLSAWSRNADSVMEELRVTPDRGLDDAEARERRRQFGANELLARKKRGVLSILLDQLGSIVVVLLLVAGGLALLMGNVAEAMAVFAVIVINTAIGFFTEWRAIRSMEALRTLAKVSCTLLRNGIARQAPAEELVPGDIVILATGDMVPADLRLIEAQKLGVDEAALTGESLPVSKDIDPLDERTALFERRNMVFKGTAITRGGGKGVVAATGLDTEFGRIFEQVSEARPRHTPLEKRLDELGKRLAWAVIVIGVLLAGVGILVGREIAMAVEVAIALAVAAIPEGLPIVATIALARGLWRMAQRHALVTRLSAVETLGATSVILTDKTGTLTESRMVVTTALLAGKEVELDDSGDAASAPLINDMLKTAVLCNDAVLQEHGSKARQGAVGSPTENALLEAAASRGMWRDDLLREAPEVAEDPFDPDSKRMATAHGYEDHVYVAVKGAPEVIINDCAFVSTESGDRELDDAGRRDWLERVEGLCERGLRTLAVARKSARPGATDFYTGLTLQGVFGMEDPPRQGIGDAIERCRKAGIAVIMVTGDHANTARNVATEIGVLDSADDTPPPLAGSEVDDMLAANRHDELLRARVFSRVTPNQKLRLIELHQQQGQLVAMTGDGVNDAPALRKADIGVAMGIRGTAVAREAAEMVLQDDDFSTIVVAVEHGRAIFENIRKFVVYLLSCNTSEILVVSLATVAGAPLPLLPLQILFLNLVTDVFPALALGVGPGRPGLMRDGPRSSREGILSRRYWLEIGLYGVIMAFVTLGAMFVAVTALGFDVTHAVTIAFSTLALAQMWHVFNMRGDIGRVFDNEITRNPWIWAALALCLALVLAAIYVPVLSDVLRLADPGLVGWALILAASLVPLLLAALVHRVRPPALTRGDA
jgi:Ca2+-transporting ATPase